MRIQEGTIKPAVNPVNQPVVESVPAPPVDPNKNEKKEPTIAELEVAVELLNTALAGLPHRLSFVLHQEVNQLQVEIVDRQDKLVKKIPPDELIELVHRIQTMIGWFLDEKV